MRYKTEFPRFNDPFPEIEGLVDISWHNDACPSLGVEISFEKWFILFVNYSDPDRREIGITQYSVHLNIEGEENQCLLETDDLEIAKSFISGFLKGFKNAK